MKANELMIGDWVNLKNGKVIMPCQVTVIGHSTQDRADIGTTVCVDLSKEFPTCIFDMDVITPIPITPEILEKNDFCYCESEGGFYDYPDYNYDKGTLEVILFNVNSDVRNNQIHIEELAITDGCKECRKVMLHLMECNFVHQLQNIFIDLDIDKEIML